MNEQALEFLRQYGDWIKDADMFSYLGYLLLWGLVEVMYRIASFCEGLVDEIFTLSSFLQDGTIGSIYKSIQILAGTVLAITLIYIAFKFMFNQKVNIKGVLIRSIVFGCLIVQFPAIINTGMDISKKTYNDTKTIGNSDSTLAFSMVKDNVADMIYLADKNFEPLNSKDTTTAKNDLTEELFLNTTLTEILTPKDINDLPGEKAQYLKYKTRAVNGALEATEIENGWFSMFDEGKFRFTANFGAILVGLATLSAAFLFSAFVIGASIIELVFTKLLFPVLAVSDVETGQRVKHMLMDVGKSFLQIILTGLSLSIFRIYFSFISTKDFNIVVYTIVCIIGIKACIDGANAFGKYLGIDVGIRSGYKALVGTASALSAVGKVGKGVAKTAKTGAEIAKGGASLVKNGVGLATDVGHKSMNGASKLVSNGVNALGSASGQISEYGLGGFAQEKVDNAKTGMKNKVEDMKDGVSNSFEKAKDGVTQPFKKIGDSYISGREDGLVGAINKKSEDKANEGVENNISQSPEKNNAEQPNQNFSPGGTNKFTDGEERAQVTNGVSDTPYVTYVSDKPAESNVEVENGYNQPSNDPNSIDIDSQEKYVGESRSGAGETIPTNGYKLNSERYEFDDYNNPQNEQKTQTLGGNAQTVTQPTKDVGRASTATNKGNAGTTQKPTNVVKNDGITNSGTNKSKLQTNQKANGSTTNLPRQPERNEFVEIANKVMGESTQPENDIIKVDFDKILNTDVSGNLDNLNDFNLFDERADHE